jgi:type IV secretory pathway VirJ component
MKTVAGTVLIALLAALPLAASEETVTFAPFGTVHLYSQTPRPSSVVIFISGDGGWKLGVVDMARALVPMDALVAGIDITRYLKETGAGNPAPPPGAAGEADRKCWDPGADFAALGKFVEKRLGYPTYVPPILVGYSSGATLVYAALVQAPPASFGGGVSLGFCPDLQVHPPICKGEGLTFERDKNGKGVDFLASDALRVPWIALQGTIDKICDPEGTRRYVQKVPRGEIVMLPKVGHGYSVPRNWMPQFKESFAKVARLAKETAAAPAAPGSAPKAPAPPAEE